MEVEEYLEAFRELFESRFGGDEVATLCRGMSAKELATMPPFPFPRYLFPSGTFPDGLRFEDETTFAVPPKVREFIDENGVDAVTEIAGELASRSRTRKTSSSDARASEEDELKAFIMEAMADELEGLDLDGEDGVLDDVTLAQLMESMRDLAGGLNGLGRDDGDSDSGSDFLPGSPSYGSPSYGSPRFRRQWSQDQSDESNDEREPQLSLGDVSAASTADIRVWIDAAKTGDLLQVMEMFDRDPALVHARSSGIGHSAAHWAAARGHVDVLKFLVDKGGYDLNMLNACDATALHSAAANGREECVRLLLERGARVDIVDEIGETPGDVALRMKNLPQELAQRLVVAQNYPISDVPMFCSACEDVETPVKVNATLQVVHEDEESNGRIVELDRAVQKRWLDAAKAGELEVMKKLYAENEDVLYANGEGTNYGFSGNTALHWAAYNARVDCVRWLCAQGMDPDVTNKGESTAAHSAAGAGRLDSLVALVHECGAEASLANDVHERPIDVARQRGHADCVVLLRDAQSISNLRKEIDRDGACSIKTARAVVQARAASDATCRGLTEKSELLNKAREIAEALPRPIRDVEIKPRPIIRRVS